MLYPAQLYREELKAKLTACWYDERYAYYFGDGREEHSIPTDAYWRHDFVHLDKDGHVDGYFSYNYNDGDCSMRNFGLISFAEDGTALVHDAINRVKYMLAHGAQRVEIWAFANNPVNKFYKRMMDRFGGKRVAYLRRTTIINGEYEDSVCYELLVEDYYERVIDMQKKKQKKQKQTCNKDLAQDTNRPYITPLITGGLAKTSTRFRGKSKSTGEWVYGAATEIVKNRAPFITDSETATEVDPSTIGQFTGLNDMNGKPIYNGDIILFQGKHRVVYWNDETFSWRLYPTVDCDRHNDLGWVAAEVPICGKMTTKIVGNVFDNKDLIPTDEEFGGMMTDGAF